MKNSINYLIATAILLVTISAVCKNRSIKKEDCSISVFIDRYKRKMPMSYPTPDTIKFNRSKHVIIKPLDCKGSFEIKEYASEKNILLFEGEYLYGHDTTVIEKVPDDPSNPDHYVMKKTRYYIPVRNGIWKYYAESGTFLKEEKYDKGKLLEAAER